MRKKLLAAIFYSIRYLFELPLIGLKKYYNVAPTILCKRTLRKQEKSIMQVFAQHMPTKQLGVMFSKHTLNILLASGRNVTDKR